MTRLLNDRKYPVKWGHSGKLGWITKAAPEVAVNEQPGPTAGKERMMDTILPARSVSSREARD